MTENVREHLRERGVTVPAADKEVKVEGVADYATWFERRVLGLDSEEYRREFWRAAFREGHTIGHMPRTWDTYLRESAEYPGAATGQLLMTTILMGGIFPFWFIHTLLDRIIRKMRRSSYYERETARRRRLAAERREIQVRRTVNARPSLESIRAAYQHVRGSPRTALHLGHLLEDLERYVDNHAYVTPGVPGIRGRAGGIKRLLEREAPDLFLHYKALMRYKAIALKIDPELVAENVQPDARVRNLTSTDGFSAGEGEVGFHSGPVRGEVQYSKMGVLVISRSDERCPSRPSGGAFSGTARG